MLNALNNFIKQFQDEIEIEPQTESKVLIQQTNNGNKKSILQFLEEVILQLSC